MCVCVFVCAILVHMHACVCVCVCGGGEAVNHHPVIESIYANATTDHDRIHQESMILNWCLPEIDLDRMLPSSSDAYPK